MAFAKFMASPAGRGVRILAGVLLIAWGLGLFGAIDQTTGIIIAVVGLVPLLAGVFNVCMIAPILGAPFSGSKVLKS